MAKICGQLTVQPGLYFHLRSYSSPLFLINKSTKVRLQQSPRSVLRGYTLTIHSVTTLCVCEHMPGGESGYTGANRSADKNISKQIESRQLRTSVVEAQPCYCVEVEVLVGDGDRFHKLTR